MADLQEDSVEIVADSEQEALSQAAAQWGVAVEQLEVLHSEAVSRMPWQPKRSRFVVGKRPEPPPVREDRDGTWEVEFKAGTVFLTVNPPVGTGGPVMPDELLAARRGWAAANIDRDKLYAVVERASGRRQPIGDYEFPRSKAVGALVASNDMAAYLVIGAGRPGPDPVVEAQAALAEAGVVYGIDLERVREALVDRVPGTVVLVAEGTEPQPGAHAQVLSTESAGSPKIRPDGSIDFSESRLDQAVAIGEALLVLDRGSRGSHGMTVRGEAIETELGKQLDLSVYVGEGVEISSDGLQLVAKIEGTPSRIGEKINLRPLLRVHRVEAGSAKIDFEGNVFVEGDVADGCSVRAEGDLTVKGSALGAHLEAGGAVILTNGMLGHGTGQIAAAAFVQAGYLEECTVTANGNVVVSKEIVGANVTAREAVLVSRGKILGGVIQAGREISAGVVGAVKRTPTRLVLLSSQAASVADDDPADEAEEDGANPQKPRRRTWIRVRDRIYPPAQLEIGSARKLIDTETPYCKFTEFNGDVVMSPYN